VKKKLKKKCKTSQWLLSSWTVFWGRNRKGDFCYSPPGNDIISPTPKTDSPMDLWLRGLRNLPALALREF